MPKLIKPITIDKRQKPGLVDGFEYVVCAANGHTIATIDQKGNPARRWRDTSRILSMRGLRKR